MTIVEIIYSQKFNEGLLLDSIVHKIELPTFLGMKINHKNKIYIVREMGDKLILIEDN